MQNYGFTFFDILLSISFLLIFTSIVVITYLRNKDKLGYQFYIPHFIWKMFVGYTFVYIYTNVYGGDTTAYFAEAQSLKNLALENPEAYLTELFSAPNPNSLPYYYTKTTGYPPIWIYGEANSWFICKIASFFAFFSFNSFLCMNLLFSFVSSGIVWRFFRFLVENTSIQVKYLAIAILFMPTVGFWCTGLMKDTVVFCAILIIFQIIFQILFTRKVKIGEILGILLATFVIVSTRAFVLLSICIPLILYLVFRTNSAKGFILKFLTRFFGISISIALIVMFSRFSNTFGEYSASNILQTAEITYNDFQQNKSYSGKRYDLGITDFTFTEMIRATPLAIITTIYRPFIWESDGALMFLNGLESLLLLYFTLKLFRRREKVVPSHLKNFSTINRQTRDLIFISIGFCLITCFFVGFTSALFGVLVRMKAPLLPFFMLLLFSRLNKSTKKNEIKN
jgi:hypothetical protein